MTERKKKERIFKAMVFTEDYIATLPVIGDEQEGEFYAEGEFEAAVLSDFNKEADIIDAECCRLEML